MTRPDVDILIVGAGIGGLTLARALERLGIRASVVDQAESFSRIGAGIQMTPNAVKVLRGLGLEDRLRQIAFDAQWRSSRHWQTGEEILRIPMGARLIERYGAPHLLLHRGDLHQTLLESLETPDIRFGSKVVSVANDDVGATVRFADGSHMTARVVVAADGVHSTARAELFGASEPTYSGTIAYRTVFPSSLLRTPLSDPKSKWRGPDRQISIYYIGDGSEVYFTTRVPHPKPERESFSLEGDLGDLRAAFADFHQEVRDFLAACPRVQKWAVFERDPMPRWYDGQVVLLGDACHPMTPSMAQGAAMAMEDAVVLARCIAESEGDIGPDTFERYQSTRHRRASLVQVESSRDQWNWTAAGSSRQGGIDTDFVYRHDAWATPLGRDAADG